jgi:hypothetical protein
MDSHGSAASSGASGTSSALGGPESEKKRRLAETDVDPSGDFTPDRSGETEDPGTGRRADNQPTENRETPARSDNREDGNRDSENAPKSGHEE